MRSPARQPFSWKREIRAAFTEHLPLKASALLVAIVMWFLVAAREPTEEVVSVRFAPRLDSALVLRDPPPIIRALVIGRASEILKLSSTPLVIRRAITSDAPDTLVVPLRTSDIEVPEGVEVLVRDVQPRAVELRFESTVSRVVPVRSAVVQRTPNATGGTEVPLRLDPSAVTISGPRRVVARIPFVSTVADSVPIDTLPHLVDIDTAGLGVVVKPSQVKATIRIPVVKRSGR